MSRSYASIAFTNRVRGLQDQVGSGPTYARHVARGRDGTNATGGADRRGDPLDDSVRDYLAGRDGFYLSSVGETGWPYVQFRGGAPGFLKVLDDHTLGWADLRGNLQLVSTGNVLGDDRVSLIVMDYAHRRRLKVFGRARVVDPQDDPALADRLRPAPEEGTVERLVVVDVEAYDWNCPQHITPRWTAAELAPRLAELRDRLAELEAENAALRADR
jgi:predicted pyridoxine 5'-phosphate oxidase superfamily flavin-nucleotide-binding protein